MKVGHDMIAVPGQVFDETLWDRVFAGQADDSSPPQSAALEGARQRDPPEGAMGEQCDGAERPEHQNVAARQVVADPPGEDAGSKIRKAPHQALSTLRA